MTRQGRSPNIGIAGRRADPVKRRARITKGSAMKTLLLATALLLGGATAAGAATPRTVSTPQGDVPLCSKTVTDECMNPQAAPAAATHHARHHHAATKRRAATVRG